MAKKKPSRPSPALLSMLPPTVRVRLAHLEAARDDDSVTPEQWEMDAMTLMQEVNHLPPAIRDAFGRAVRQLGASERRENQSARSAVRELKAAEENEGTPEPSNQVIYADPGSGRSLRGSSTS